MAKAKAATKQAKARQAKADAQIYQILKPAQLEAVVSTRRREILYQVSSFGPMSVRDLALALEVAPSSLYYHIEHLCSVGLLIEAGVRQESNKPEQLYATPGRRMLLLGALQDPRNDRVLKEIVASMCRQADKDFARGAKAKHRKTSGEKRNTRFARLVFRPDAATIEKINEHMDAITELIFASSNGPGKRVAMTWLVSPLHGRREND